MARTWNVAVALALCAVCGVNAEKSAVAQAPRTSFRAAVELVPLSVTVRNGARQYVEDLNVDDFVVLENGVRQAVTFFGKSNVPLGVAVLIDTSASMEQALPIAQEAAATFVRTLRADDLIAVFDFDSTVKTAQPFTNDVAALVAAIRGTTADGSTAMFNALYIALNQLNKLGSENHYQAPRRRAIILLSDGDDTSSLLGFDEVLDLASRSDTVIYTIGLGSREATRPGAMREGEFILRHLAEQTGGRAFFPKEARELTSVYSDIREELSSQYSLAYESSGPLRNGQWRRIAVRVNRPNLTVRTRQGYFAPGK